MDLALELRPKSLDEVIGHESIKPVIKKFIAQEHLKWLFYGPTGTGKTSLAYIVARELLGSDNGLVVDGLSVIEIDCGDWGTADMRKLIRDTQCYPISGGKYRIIILDEAHLLTEAARSLLLKPLEEKESCNVWILCTMNVGNLHRALRDRCARFKLEEMGPSQQRQLVARAAAHVNDTRDTSQLLRTLDAHKVGSARDIVRSFESFHNGMSAEDAVGE